MKVAFLGACFVVVFAALGCGSSSSRDAASDGSAPTTSVKTPTNTVDPPRAEVRTSWMMLFTEQGTESAPPQELYAVFTRKQTDDEAKIAPRLVVDYPCAFEGSRKGERSAGGKPAPEQARILLRGVDAGEDSLVAVAMTDGSVSVAVFPNGGATCGRPTRDGLILAAEIHDDTATVYGMVDDQVQSVDAVVDGQTHRSKLGENGFSLTLPDAEAMSLEKLVLEKADGSKTEFPLG
jgi:hypothetical protein